MAFSPMSGLKAFDEKYILGNEIGRGAFSTVCTTCLVSDEHQVFAVKCIQKAKLTKADEIGLRQEIEILSAIDHPGVIKLFDYIEEPHNYFVVLEMMEGGELLRQLSTRENYSERDARGVIRSVANVLAHLHENDIAHRDLKPENILYKDVQGTHLKMADFGFAKYCKEGCKSACGTADYVAPEVISGKVYNHSCDNWSLGVLTYLLIFGYPPFHAPNRKELFRQIRSAEYAMVDEHDEVSKEVKDLIRKLLVVDVNSRWTAKQVLEHPWIKTREASSTRHLMGNQQDNLLVYTARRKLRAGMQLAIAMGRIQDLVEAIKEQRSAS